MNALTRQQTFILETKTTHYSSQKFFPASMQIVHKQTFKRLLSHGQVWAFTRKNLTALAGHQNPCGSRMHLNVSCGSNFTFREPQAALLLTREPQADAPSPKAAP